MISDVDLLSRAAKPLFFSSIRRLARYFDPFETRQRSRLRKRTVTFFYHPPPPLHALFRRFFQSFLGAGGELHRQAAEKSPLKLRHRIHNYAAVMKNHLPPPVGDRPSFASSILGFFSFALSFLAPVILRRYMPRLLPVNNLSSLSFLSTCLNFSRIFESRSGAPRQQWSPAHFDDGPRLKNVPGMLIRPQRRCLKQQR